MGKTLTSEEREASKERRRQYLRDWERNNPEKAKAKRKKWNDKNRKEYSKKYRNTFPEKTKLYGKRSELKRKYNLSMQQLEEMKIIQENKCFICGMMPKNLNVDHNHTTGKIRKLLCLKCNTSIGLMREDIDLLNKMINYIKSEGKSIC